MKWYNYIACFFCGFFWTNVVPHFIHGISGDNFPTPFADPPGKGLSSPMVNVLWALTNMIIGYLLFKASKMSGKNRMALFVFFMGIVLCSVMLSISFVGKMH